MADISKITLPNNSQYDIKDNVARGQIENLQNELNAASIPTNTYTLNAINNVKSAWNNYTIGFSTTNVSSTGGPAFGAYIFKYNASYGCILLVTYSSGTETTPVFIQNANGIWSYKTLL